MLVDVRTVRRSPWCRLLFGSTLLLLTLVYLGRPYAGTVRAKFPELGNQIAAKLDSFHKPAAIPNDFQYSPIQDANATAQSLWAKLQPLLDDNPPTASEIPGWNGLDFTMFGTGAKSNDYSQDILNISPLDLIRMRDAHRLFVQGIKAQFPHYIPASDSSRRGIVTTAAGYYLPVAVVSLRMLRRTGTTLPVEIWMNTREEYEPYICEQALPAMNAKCRILEDIFHHDDKKFKMAKEIEHFQFKIFAILFSSFQEVMWLDADNFPLHEPEELFETEPFKSTGMVIWPDFWYRTVSPAYHLVNDKFPEPRDVRPAAETGQMMLNKETHLHVLLLVAYYNYYGPSHYYGLLCQNGPGRGDKETFIPAATSLDMPFYQVHQGVEAVGHTNAQHDGIWIFAMIQYDPVQDFHRWRNESSTHGNKTLTSQFDSYDDEAAPRPFFLHCNSPKWNPKNVFDHVGVYDLTWDVWQNEAPSFTHPPEAVAQISGVEKSMWEEVRWVACVLEGKFADWEGRDDVCANVQSYFDHVLEPISDEAANTPPDTGDELVAQTTNENGQVNYEENGEGDERLKMSDDGEVTSTDDESGNESKDSSHDKANVPTDDEAGEGPADDEDEGWETKEAITKEAIDREEEEQEETEPEKEKPKAKTKAKARPKSKSKPKSSDKKDPVPVRKKGGKSRHRQKAGKE